MSNTKLIRLSGTESVKSFVDDFDMKRSIVSARVGLSYDPLRLSSCFQICYPICGHSPRYPPTYLTTYKLKLIKNKQTPILYTNSTHTRSHISPTLHMYTSSISYNKSTKLITHHTSLSFVRYYIGSIGLFIQYIYYSNLIIGLS
jgi:hypothetical protein